MSKMPNGSGDVYKIAVLGDEGSGKTGSYILYKSKYEKVGVTKV